MIVLGLTGSIGMGKSATATMFEAAGVPVHSADAAVHRLYSGKASPGVEALFPGTVIDGVVDRDRLAARVLGDAPALKALEALVHPLVREEERRFLDAARERGEPLVVLDIPLLFETAGEGRVDRILVVTAPAEVQRARVLARPGMSVERFEAILAQQLPDAEKRRRADVVIDTSNGFDAARREVKALIGRLADAEGAPLCLPASPPQGRRSGRSPPAELPISPLEGEMSGRTEAAPPAGLCRDPDRTYSEPAFRHLAPEPRDSHKMKPPKG